MDNPYAKPLIVEAFDPLVIVHWPAFCLRIVGGFGVIVCALNVLHEISKWLLRLGFGVNRDFFDMASHVAVIFGITVAQALVFLGGTEMKQLKSYRLTIGGAIIASIPCVSPCFLDGWLFGHWFWFVLFAPFYLASVPVGLWCVITLIREDIRGAFED